MADDTEPEPDGGTTAAEAIRSLIGEVVLRPGAKRRQVMAELRGELMGILDFAEGHQRQRISKVRTNAVALPGSARRGTAGAVSQVVTGGDEAAMDVVMQPEYAKAIGRMAYVWAGRW
jgi:hypothetical protein